MCFVCGCGVVLSWHAGRNVSPDVSSGACPCACGRERQRERLMPEHYSDGQSQQPTVVHIEMPTQQAFVVRLLYTVCQYLTRGYVLMRYSKMHTKKRQSQITLISFTLTNFLADVRSFYELRILMSFDAVITGMCE